MPAQAVVTLQFCAARREEGGMLSLCLFRQSRVALRIAANKVAMPPSLKRAFDSSSAMASRPFGMTFVGALRRRSASMHEVLALALALVPLVRATSSSCPLGGELYFSQVQEASSEVAHLRP
jgi:hypothetical protein